MLGRGDAGAGFCLWGWGRSAGLVGGGWGEGWDGPVDGEGDSTGCCWYGRVHGFRLSGLVYAVHVTVIIAGRGAGLGGGGVWLFSCRCVS